jgi:hypothetical protein
VNTEDRRPKAQDTRPFSRGHQAMSPPCLPVSPSPRLPLPPSFRRARGFSFTEILFAIMILGIGFILVAAMFPVAIQQTETSRQETVGAAVARGGVGFVQQMANVNFIQSIPPPTKPLPLVPLCALRPTVVFGGNLQVWDDQNLYNAVYFNTAPLANALPTTWTQPGTYIIQGEVWDFTPVLTKYFGSEIVSSVNGTPLSSTVTLTSLLTNMASENMVQASDPRFAWIGFYKRDLVMTITTAPGGVAPTRTFAYAPSAQVIIVATQVRTGQGYAVSLPANGVSPMLDLPNFPSNNVLSAQDLPPPPSLQASRSNSVGGGANPAIIAPPSSTHLDPYITFGDQVQVNRAAEGAFVIIAADSPTGTNGMLNTADHGLLNGRIYRLGAFDPTVSGWNFAPGYGPSASDLFLMTHDFNFKFLVYIVGKGQDPDSATAGTYTGVAQDIAVYSTFISCPNN